MTRRCFVTGAACAIGRAAGSQPRIAITMDDVYWSNLPDPWDANRRLLEAMAKHRARLALFVIGKNADSKTGREIVETWKRAGHLIGNHTYSHRNYHSCTFEEFSADATRAGEVLAPNLTSPLLFRFPMLKEGDTAEKRDRMRAFMAENGWGNGHVTIDTSDWYYEARLRQRLAADTKFDVNRFRTPYLDHICDRAQFYDELARRTLGRSVAHTILTHYTFLNSLFLGDVLDMFASRGWRIVDAEEAYRDPVFRRQPKIVPAGESLIWALAKETGKFDGVLRYPGEDGDYEKKKVDRI